jgi:hypothetical protein
VSRPFLGWRCAEELHKAVLCLRKEEAEISLSTKARQYWLDTELLKLNTHVVEVLPKALIPPRIEFSRNEPTSVRVLMVI